MRTLTPRFKPNYNWKEWLAALYFWRDERDLYESEYAEKFHCSYGVMFSYGRSALMALFDIWEIKNTEIICPAYTCVVVSNAIVLSKNKPVFVDCEKNSFHMDYEALESKISENTSAIIVTHLFGGAMDVRKIDRIIRKAEEKFNSKIYVIQDVAHSYGSSFNNELVTTFGDAAIFGCNISKIINSIFGGFVVTNSIQTYDKLKLYQSNKLVKPNWFKEPQRLLYLIFATIAFNKYFYFWINLLVKNGFLDRFTKYYEDVNIYLPTDWNESPKNIEARVGRVQLKKYDKIILERRSIAKNIIEFFENDDRVDIKPFDENNTYSHIVAIVENRDDWILKFHKKGIELGSIIDYSVPEMKAYKKYINNLSDFPVSSFYRSHIINFPISENFFKMIKND